MADDSGQPTAKRRSPLAYPKMSTMDIETRLGTTMEYLASTATAVEEMISPVYTQADNFKSIKEEVYKQLVRYLRIEGHYWITGTEMNISDLVYAIISPIIDDFIYNTGLRTFHLYRERQPVFVDCKPEGYEGFVVVDRIFGEKGSYLLIIEAPTEAALSVAVGPCLLTLKDMHDGRVGGILYGFVTTGDSWRMLSYDGQAFKVTNKIEVVFDTMARDKEKWMKQFSALVGCVYAALENLNYCCG